MKRSLNYLIKLINHFFRQKRYTIQTFTYYIPSPPLRKKGYREKEFDKQLFKFINNGYEIISVNTQNNYTNSHSGMWVIFTVRALNEKASELKFDQSDELGQYDEQESFPEEDLSSNKIEGLYYID